MILKLEKIKHPLIKTLLLCFVVAAIPFKLNLGNLAIILALIYNVLFFEKGNFRKLTKGGFILPVLLFAFILISSIFSKNDYGIKRLDLEFLSLAVTLIVINFNFTPKNISYIFKSFYFSNILSVTILLAIAFLGLINGGNISDVSFHNFTGLFDQHPVFFSMYLSLALGLSINTNLGLTKHQLIFGYLLLIIGIIFCASKAVILFDLFAILTFCLLNSRRKHKAILLLFFVFSIVFINVPFLKKRFTEGLEFKKEIIDFHPTNDFSLKKRFSYDEKSDISDLELRYILAKIGLYHQIEDKKLIFGYGKGDSKDYLNYYLFSYNLGPNWFEDFNLHNQYLDILFNLGALALIIFLIYLYYSIRIAFKRKDYNHIFFILFFSFVFLFDAPLTINKGIVFFYVFNAIFIFKELAFESNNFRYQRNSKSSWRL